MLNGYSGYYYTGYTESGREFGYRLLTDDRQTRRLVQGVSSVEKTYVIEVMGDENPFSERQKVKLQNGKEGRIRKVDETPFCVDGTEMIILLEVVIS